MHCPPFPVILHFILVLILSALITQLIMFFPRLYPTLFLPLTLAIRLTWDTSYSLATTPTTSLACSDGSHGLASAGFIHLGEVPTWPNVAATNAITGKGSFRFPYLLFLGL